MTVSLRVVLDQLAGGGDVELATASRELARELVATAPSGCVVDAIVPAGDPIEVPGIADERRLPRPRRELQAAWQLGVTVGVGGGMIHSPTLMAPLTRHDRVNDHDQTVVTVWDLRAWLAPDELPRSTVAWQKGMLRRAARFADAVVVPSHAMAERLAELGRFGERIRIIAGAAPTAFSVPTDEVARRRELALPERYAVIAGASGEADGLAEGLHAVAATDLDAVVIGVADGGEPAVADLAAAAGLPERRVHVRGTMEQGDRAAAIGHAAALVAPSAREVWPWRVLEAMALGVPVAAVDSAQHREVVLDGGVLADGRDLGEALADAVGEAQRLGVLARDRAKAFSWHAAAEQVWQLHADL